MDRETDNQIDAIFALADATRRIADAIVPGGASPGYDEMGGLVGSLTEAVMGLTKALAAIANAVDSVAGAIRDRGE